ncbi:MAG: hypothetical protein WBV94_08425 [Blastocatellia bacterium]
MVKKIGNRWWYDFQVRGVRYRRSIPEARNKAQAERAEARIRLEIFESKFGDGISMKLAEFVRREYEPFAKTKRNYRTSDKVHIATILAYFKEQSLSDISPMSVERFKRERLVVPARGIKPRNPHLLIENWLVCHTSSRWRKSMA